MHWPGTVEVSRWMLWVVWIDVLFWFGGRWSMNGGRSVRESIRRDLIWGDLLIMYSRSYLCLRQAFLRLLNPHRMGL